MLKNYLGTKLVQAEPMTRGYFTVMEKGGETPKENYHDEGYKVVYPDGYVSWSPKEVFEKAYMQFGDNNTVTQEMVDNFIVDYDTFTKKGKITIVIATLVNGFTIVESSACVDPSNYSEEIGAEICKDKIKDKVWNHLGFLLQTGLGGIK